MIMMFLKPSAKILKFIACGSGFQALGRGQYGNIVKAIKFHNIFRYKLLFTHQEVTIKGLQVSFY